MAEEFHKADPRFDYIKERISSAFPKLLGPKFDKQITADDVRLVDCIQVYFKNQDYHDEISAFFLL
jgi:hypothetical protein